MNEAVTTGNPHFQKGPLSPFQNPDEPLSYALLHVLNGLPIPPGLVAPPSKTLSLYIERGNRADCTDRAGALFSPTIEERALESLASSYRTPHGWRPPSGHVINKGVIQGGIVAPDENALFGLAVAGILGHHGLDATVEGFPGEELYGVAGRLDTAYPVNLNKLLGNRFLSYLIAPIDSIYGAEEICASAARDEPPPATPVLFHDRGGGLLYLVDKCGDNERIKSYKNGFELTSDEQNGVLPFSNISVPRSFQSSQDPGRFQHLYFPPNTPTFYFTGSREELLKMIREEGWRTLNPPPFSAHMSSLSLERHSVAEAYTSVAPPPS